MDPISKAAFNYQFDCSFQHCVSSTADEMAVSGRLLRNSTTPFSCSLGTDRNKADQAYETHVQRVEDKRRKESKGDIMENVHPIIAKVLTQGTAQVGEGPPNCWEDSPFIAQAECEYK